MNSEDLQNNNIQSEDMATEDMVTEDMITEDLTVEETVGDKNDGIDNVKHNSSDISGEDADTESDEPQYKEYSDDYLTSALEAILFSLGESVSVDRLAAALEMEKKKLVKQLETVVFNYNNNDRGIKIIDLDGSLQLCTRNEYYGVLAKIVNTPKKLSLTDVVLETLSIIAYKQPITRPEIEAIRGVSCVHAINKLIEYNLVQEVGRLDAPGRPIMFGTTEEFLRCFGVSSTSDLPVISPDKIEDFKKEALEEADFTLSVDTTSED